MLNEWTYGQLWKNLVIVKGRTEFTDEFLENRISEIKNVKLSCNVLRKEHGSVEYKNIDNDIIGYFKQILYTNGLKKL